MREIYECKWCYGQFGDRAECVEHEPKCHDNPATRSCETCDHHDTVVADTGKVWNTCGVGLLTSPRWVENHASGCPKWSRDYKPEKWWFNTDQMIAFKETADDVPCAACVEVTAGYAAYLRDKPEGEWELRRVETGDTCWNADGENVAFVAGSNYKDAGANDRGYRWCKPRVDVEALRKEMGAAMEARNKADRAYIAAFERLADALNGGAA